MELDSPRHIVRRPATRTTAITIVPLSKRFGKLNGDLTSCVLRWLRRRSDVHGLACVSKHYSEALRDYLNAARSIRRFPRWPRSNRQHAKFLRDLGKVFKKLTPQQRHLLEIGPNWILPSAQHSVDDGFMLRPGLTHAQKLASMCKVMSTLPPGPLQNAAALALWKQLRHIPPDQLNGAFDRLLSVTKEFLDIGAVLSEVASELSLQELRSGFALFKRLLDEALVLQAHDASGCQQILCQLACAPCLDQANENIHQRLVEAFVHLPKEIVAKTIASMFKSLRSIPVEFQDRLRVVLVGMPQMLESLLAPCSEDERIDATTEYRAFAIRVTTATLQTRIFQALARDLLRKRRIDKFGVLGECLGAMPIREQRKQYLYVVDLLNALTNDDERRHARRLLERSALLLPEVTASLRQDHWTQMQEFSGLPSPQQLVSLFDWINLACRHVDFRPPAGLLGMVDAILNSPPATQESLLGKLFVTLRRLLEHGKAPFEIEFFVEEHLAKRGAGDVMAHLKAVLMEEAGGDTSFRARTRACC